VSATTTMGAAAGPAARRVFGSSNKADNAVRILLMDYLLLILPLTM
jgi:hypothetical protein